MDEKKEKLRKALEEKKVFELRVLCKRFNLSGWSNKNKSPLIDMLIETEALKNIAVDDSIEKNVKLKITFWEKYHRIASFASIISLLFGFFCFNIITILNKVPDDNLEKVESNQKSEEIQHKTLQEENQRTTSDKELRKNDPQNDFTMINGRVINEQGDPIIDAKVFILGYEDQYVLTNELGQFEVETHEKKGERVKLKVTKDKLKYSAYMFSGKSVNITMRK